MRSTFRFLILALGLATIGIGSDAVAEVPNLSAERMQDMASDVIVGKIARIYTMVDHSSTEWEVTYSVAEIQVKSVEKGKQPRPLAYVRFSHRRYVGTGPPMVGANGQRGVPSIGDVARAYVTTAKDGGYDAISPNGLAAVRESDDKK
jgi:hypothetical protein